MLGVLNGLGVGTFRWLIPGGEGEYVQPPPQGAGYTYNLHLEVEVSTYDLHLKVKAVRTHLNLEVRPLNRQGRYSSPD